jgi:hypothetical protein
VVAHLPSIVPLCCHFRSVRVVAVIAADGICDAYVVLGLAGEVESVNEDRCVHAHLQPPVPSHVLVLLRVSSLVDYGR